MTPLATIISYDDLIAAMRARADQLEISRENIDEIAGWADRLAAKLLSPNPVKRLGMQTLGPMLGVLGMKLIAVEDEDTLKRFSHRRMLRNASQVRVHQTRKAKEIALSTSQVAHALAMLSPVGDSRNCGRRLI